MDQALQARSWISRALYKATHWRSFTPVQSPEPKDPTIARGWKLPCHSDSWGRRTELSMIRCPMDMMKPRSYATQFASDRADRTMPAVFIISSMLVLVIVWSTRVAVYKTRSLQPDSENKARMADLSFLFCVWPPEIRASLYGQPVPTRLGDLVYEFLPTVGSATIAALCFACTEVSNPSAVHGIVEHVVGKVANTWKCKLRIWNGEDSDLVERECKEDLEAEVEKFAKRAIEILQIIPADWRDETGTELIAMSRCLMHTFRGPHGSFRKNLKLLCCRTRGTRFSDSVDSMGCFVAPHLALAPKKDRPALAAIDKDAMARILYYELAELRSVAAPWIAHPREVSVSMPSYLRDH